MLSEEILFAMNDIDDGTLESVSRRLGYKYKAAKTTPVRVGRLSRRAVLLAAAVAAFLALSAVAYAANLWGIREMFNNPNRTLPEAAEDLIAAQDESARQDGLSCRVTESLCDTTRILLTVTVTGDEEHILVPQDAMPENSLGDIGRDGEGTLAGYAARQGKELLFIGASLTLPGPGGPENITQSVQASCISDSEMAFLIEADRPATATLDGAVCLITSLKAGDTSAERLELPVALTEAPSEAEMVFVPEDPNAVPGIQVGEATVTISPLGVSAAWPETVTNEEDYYKIMKIDFEELTDFEGHGTVLGDDGVWRNQISMGQGVVTDTLTVHYYDWDKKPIGDIVFRKK